MKLSKIILSATLFFALSTTPLSVSATTTSAPVYLANINAYSVPPKSLFRCNWVQKYPAGQVAYNPSAFC